MRIFRFRQIRQKKGFYNFLQGILLSFTKDMHVFDGSYIQEEMVLQNHESENFQRSTMLIIVNFRFLRHIFHVLVVYLYRGEALRMITENIVTYDLYNEIELLSLYVNSHNHFYCTFMTCDYALLQNCNVNNNKHYRLCRTFWDDKINLCGIFLPKCNYYKILF